MLRRILVETRLYHRLAFDWIEKHRPALSIVYFQGTDSIGHVFAAYAPPRQPEVAAADFERYNRVPELYFAEIDGLLGEYRRLAGEIGAALLIVSDHGFRWREGRPVTSSGLAGATAALWHREDGVYVLTGRGIEPVTERGAGQVGQVAATIVALLGLPRAAGTEGPALGGIAEVLPARDYGPRTRGASVDTSAPSAESLSRLKALGYVGSSEPTTRTQGATGTRTAGSFHNEGVLLLQQKKTAEARAAFEQALRLDPHLAAAEYSLAALLEAAGESGRADELLLRAVADGLAEGARRVEEIATAAYRQGDVGRAQRLLDGAIGHVPSDAPLRIARGHLRIQQRDCPGAFEDFDAARRLAPRLARAHGLAGTALLCLGKPAEARLAFEQSLALDPSQTRLRELLAGGR
jgi:Tfp pilus assembly protein PilF